MTKAEIRELIASRRQDFQPLEKRRGEGSASFQCLEKMSAAVLENFQGLEVFQQAQAIGAYMPLPDEVDVTPIFQGLETNCVGARNFYIPAFDEEADGYRMAKFSKDWKKGKFGIPEPVEPVWAGSDELDLILVPGVAFDRHGNRLGRGGGFYDRLLPQYSAVRVGICFDFQTLEKIPAEPHDCRMHWLVTEEEICCFANKYREEHI